VNNDIRNSIVQTIELFQNVQFMYFVDIYIIVTGLIVIVVVAMVSQSGSACMGNSCPKESRNSTADTCVPETHLWWPKIDQTDAEALLPFLHD